MASTIPSLDFQLFLNCEVDVTPLRTDVQTDRGFRMKGIKDTLWFNNYSRVNILKEQTRTILKRARSFPAPVLQRHGADYDTEIISVTDSRESPVIALHAKIRNQHSYQHINEGLMQVGYDGTRDCIIAGGPFYQITSSLYDDTLLCGIRNMHEISFYKFDSCNANNKWIHVKNIALNGEFTRIQIRRNTVLVGGRHGTCLHEIDIETGQVIRVIRHSNTKGEGMYLCTLDANENAFVVDIKTGSLYILEKDSDQLLPLETNITIREPHDATIFNNELLVVDNDGNLFRLNPRTV